MKQTTVDLTNQTLWRSLYQDVERRRRGQLVSLVINLKTTEVTIKNHLLADLGTQITESDHFQMIDDCNLNPQKNTLAQFLQSNPKIKATVIGFYENDNTTTCKSTIVIGGNIDNFIDHAIEFAEVIANAQ